MAQALIPSSSKMEERQRIGLSGLGCIQGSQLDGKLRTGLTGRRSTIQPPFVILSLVNTYACTLTLSHTHTLTHASVALTPAKSRNRAQSNRNLPVTMVELWCSESLNLAAKRLGEDVSWKIVVYFWY